MVHLGRVNNSSLLEQWHFFSLGPAKIAVTFCRDIVELSHMRRWKFLCETRPCRVFKWGCDLIMRYVPNVGLTFSLTCAVYIWIFRIKMKLLRTHYNMYILNNVLINLIHK